MTGDATQDVGFDNPAVRAAVEQGIAHWQETNKEDPERDARVAEGRVNGLAFDQTYLPHVCTAPPAPGFHEVLDSIHEDAAIEAPRGHAKSVRLLLRRSLRTILYDGPIHYRVIVRDAMAKAVRMLEFIRRELTSNQAIVRDFGLKVDEEHTTADRLITTNGYCIQARGFEQAFQGLTFYEMRPQEVDFDDPDDYESVQSKDQRDKKEQQFLGDVLPALAKGGKAIVVFTRIHDDCLGARLSRNPSFRSLRFKAVIQHATRQDLWTAWENLYRTKGPAVAQLFYQVRRAGMDAGAVVLWPGLWDYHALRMLKMKIGSVVFSRELLMEPVDPETAIFKPHWFPADAALASLAGQPISHVCKVDPAMGKKPTGDGSATVVIGITQAGKIKGLRYDCRVRSVNTLCEDLYALDRMYPQMVFKIEEVAFSGLLKNVLDGMAQGKGRRLAVRTVKVGADSKEFRTLQLTPWIEDGTITLMRDGPGMSQLIDELTAWRPGQTGDDHGIDALSLDVQHEVGGQPHGYFPGRRPNIGRNTMFTDRLGRKTA